MARRDEEAQQPTGSYTAAELRASDTFTPPFRAGRLVALTGPEVGRVYTLDTRDQVVGRGSGVDLAIEGEDVSRRHARITWAGGQHFVEDLGSRNGTQVNGMQISRAPLRPGDRIQLGGTVTLVYVEDDDLERRAARLQKLESLAQVAGGMVHDLKNTLSVVLANLDVLEEKLRATPDPEVIECVQDIRQAVGQTSDLTQRLLYFSRRETVAPQQAVDIVLRELIEEVLGMVRRSFEAQSQIRIDVAVAPQLTVRGQKNELHHALLNLVLNARDAMPRGGRLAITARALQVSRADALRLHLHGPGPYIEIAVADTGVGMDQATLARVFEPFFTTKRPGQGTGLGLSTVYGIVRHHGGNVQVDSAPGEGTCFRILLPTSLASQLPGRSPTADAAG